MITDTPKKRRLPPLGMRIVKTGISVFFCLLLNYLFSAEVALVSSLAAIVSMQSSLDGTMKTAIARSSGTALGGFMGIAMLPLSRSIDSELLYIALMPIGMIFVIYLCVLFKMPGSVAICAYVYITVLVVPIEGTMKEAYMDGLLRIADTAFGVLISILVNRFIDPPKPPPVRDVDVPVNSFDSIYGRVENLLPASAQLILVDLRLVDPSVLPPAPPADSTGLSADTSGGESVSLPVPTVFSKANRLQAVYIGQDYSAHMFSLPQSNGYVALPQESFPVLVAWHVEQSDQATYDMFKHIRRRDASVLRRSRRPVQTPTQTVTKDSV